MEIIQTWLDSSNIPILTAFLLGLLTAISPCPMATNITAIAYISKDIQSKHLIFLNGILYTIGRIDTEMAKPLSSYTIYSSRHLLRNYLLPIKNLLLLTPV